MGTTRLASMIDSLAMRLTSVDAGSDIFRPSEKIMKSQMHTRNFRTGGRFIGFARADSDKEALVPVSHERHVQMKSQRSPCVITGDPGHSPPQVLKSSTAQGQCPRLIGRNRRRASNRQRQTAAKLVTFMAAIWRFMKAYTILWQKLYAWFSEHAFHQGNRVPGSHLAPQLNIPDRTSTQTGRLSQVLNRQIEPSTRDTNLCACRARNAKQSNQGGIQ